MNVFEEKQCSVIATQLVEGPAISSYGVMKAKEVAGSGGKLYEVLDLVEKPKLADAPSNLAVIGRYILTPTVFETLSDIKPGAGGELQLTDGLRGLLQAREDLCLCLRRTPPRYRRQTWLSESDSGVCAEAQRSGRGLPGVSEEFETVTARREDYLRREHRRAGSRGGLQL